MTTISFGLCSLLFSINHHLFELDHTASINHSTRPLLFRTNALDMETMVPVCARFQQCFSRYVRLFPRFSLRRVTIAACLTLALLACLLSISAHGGTTSATNGYTFSKHILRPASAHQKTGKSPVEWLQRNSNNKYDYNQQTSWSTLFRPSYWSSRPKAAIITLVRNEELSGIMQSMRQLEYHWNHKYRYPWIFFNEQPFSQAFKVCLSSPSPLSSLTFCRQQPQTSYPHPASTKSSHQNTGPHQVSSIRTVTWIASNTST